MALRFSLLTAVALLAACGGNKNVKLLYPDRDAASPATRCGTEIALEELSDRRPVEPRALGYLYGINRNVVGHLETKDDVRQWIGRGLEVELGRAGFNLRPGAATKPGALRMAVGIAKVLSGTDHAHYAGAVGLAVRVQRADQVVLEEDFESKYVGDMNVAGSPEGYGETLGMALRATARQVAAAVTEKVGPTAGARLDCSRD
jgi:hypothetical protein